MEKMTTDLELTDNPAAEASMFDTEDEGRISPASPRLIGEATTEAIRDTVHAPARAAVMMGGKGWSVLRAGVNLAKEARPQEIDEEELMRIAHASNDYRPLWVIDPRSSFWQVWCLVQGGIVCLLMFWVPFELAFVCMDVLTECKDFKLPAVLNDAKAHDDGSDGAPDCSVWNGPSTAELTIRLVMDLLILADFGMHFVLGYSKWDLRRRKPVWIWHEKAIVKHYVASPSFLYDLVGCLPIDTLYRIQGNGVTSYVTADILSVLRMARLQSAFKLTQPLHDFVNHVAVFFPPIEPISKLFMLIVWIAGITHIMACLLYFVGHPWWDAGDMRCQEHGVCGWVTAQGWQEETFDPGGVDTGNGHSTVYTKYVTALYYASTQITTVGFGDISAATTFERLFSVFSQMFGGFVFGYVLGNISTVLANENRAASTHKSYLEQISHFMKAEAVPPPLKKKVLQFLEARYPRHFMFDEGFMWTELPPTLRGEIAVHRHGHVVEHGTLFHDLEYATLSLLCQRIDVMSFMQGDTVTSAGAYADRMFIVKVGTVHIFKHTEEHEDQQLSQTIRSDKLKKLHKDQAENEMLIEVAVTGTAFAELAALMPYTQQLTCRCAAYCLVCTLTRESVLQLAQIRNDLADSIIRFAKQSQAKIVELCSKTKGSNTYESVLANLERLKSSDVPPNIDAILGGGISGGVSACPYKL